MENNNIKNQINQAAKLIEAGDVVALPTDTVYGLVADASNPTAVDKVYEVKGRPQTKPLIVLVANLKQAKGYVAKLTTEAKILAKHFWPGALTIILPKGEKAIDEVTCGQDSIGVRMPNNKIALKVIKKSGCAVVGPSANTSGKPSPTTAQMVADDLGGKLPLIIDGGTSPVGVPSTIISLVGEPTILRTGSVTKQQIESVLKVPVKVIEQ